MSIPSHRRDFVRSLVLGASAGLVAGPSSPRADEPAAKDDGPKPGPPRTEADARMDLVLARFGAQLDDDARRAVRAEVEAITRLAEGLRRFPLDNGDAPVFVFAPYHAADDPRAS
jgi:hypothetical protein